MFLEVAIGARSRVSAKAVYGLPQRRRGGHFEFVPPEDWSSSSLPARIRKDGVEFREGEALNRIVTVYEYRQHVVGRLELTWVHIQNAP